MRVRGLFWGKGVDSLRQMSGVNLEFGQGMDGWTFVSFCAGVSRISIRNLIIVKRLESFPETHHCDINVVNIL